jgi:hypothetical protein
MWFKSSYSGGEGNECVEVAHGHSWVRIRDSKVPQRGDVAVSVAAFATFVAGIKATS